MMSVEHFEIPVDDLQRAQKFYGHIFGWQFETGNFDGFEYTSVLSKGDNPESAGINGGMMKRQNPEQQITNYITVPSIDDMLVQIQAHNGKILMPKQEISGIGYFALCQDTENNTFGIWENISK